MFRFFIYSQVFWDKTGLSNKYVSLFTRGVFSAPPSPTPKKNVYEEARMIVKIEVVFSIAFQPDYRDLIYKHSTNVLLLLP